MSPVARNLLSTLLFAGALVVVLPARAADTDGLDLTIEVLGKNERVDERIVNRIEVPGIRLGARSAAAGIKPGTETASPPIQPPPLERPLGLVRDLTRDALERLRLRQEPAQ